MRLNEYYSEEPTSIKSIVDELFKLGISEKYLNDCKKAGDFLYRGSEKRIKDYLYVVPRTNRKPIGMSIKAQEMLDKIFLKRFGWKPRSEGVFVTGYYRNAALFGKPYIFIPENDNYKFVWSPKIEDINYDEDFNILHEEMLNNEDDRTDEFMKELEIITKSYKDSNFVAAIESGNEISLKLQTGFYLVDVDYRNEIEEIMGWK